MRCAPARPCSRLLAAARSFFPPSLLHELQAGYVKRAVWWRAHELTGLGTDRVEVDPETPLVAFCTGRFQGLAKSFTLPDGTFMLVADLGGFTEDKLMAFVERQGGPRMLVPAWLKQHGLRSYLDGYVASMDASSTLETASRQMGALSLSSSGSLTRKIIIQQFGSTSSGRHVSFECLKGENFLPTAEARVRDEFQISPSDDVEFCCYVLGGSGRFCFNHSDGYWSVVSTSCIYFFEQATTTFAQENAARRTR